MNGILPEYADLLAQAALDYKGGAPFPLGVRSIPSPLETKIVAAFAEGGRIVRDDCARITSQFGRLDDYGLLHLSCRLALWGVRTNDPERLRAGFSGLLFGDRGKSADYRDVWEALALVNYCCEQLSVSFDDEFAGQAAVASDDRNDRIRNWLESDRDMRRHHLFPIGSGASLTFSSKGFVFDV